VEEQGQVEIYGGLVYYEGLVYEENLHLAEQIDQLRDDLEEAYMERNKARLLAERWHESWLSTENKYKQLEDSFESKLTATNHALKDKCMILLDLIALYEDQLLQYRTFNNVTQTNPEITELRRKAHLEI
jgi:hypothetical protein